MGWREDLKELTKGMNTIDRKVDISQLKLETLDNSYSKHKERDEQRHIEILNNISSCSSENKKLIENQGIEIQNITLKRPWRSDLIKNTRTLLGIIAGVLGIIWTLKRFHLWEKI